MTEKQTTTKRAPRKVQTPKANPAKKTAAKKPETKAADAPKKREPWVNPHTEAGIDVARYDGLSKFINGNRKPKVAIDTRRVTDRAAKGLYALRDCYGSKEFQPRGFDNGLLARLLSEGMIEPIGGTKQTIDGAEYLVDGAEPLRFRITKAGMEHGKAA